VTEPEVRVESDRLKIEPDDQASVKVSIIKRGMIVEGIG
jgi:hypothetical protein